MDAGPFPDDGAAAVEYAILAAAAAMLLTGAALLAPTLDFGLPAFAAAGWGAVRGEPSGGGGGPRDGAVTGSGDSLAPDVADDAGLPAADVECPDYPPPAAGQVVLCHVSDPPQTIRVTFTDSSGAFETAIVP